MNRLNILLTEKAADAISNNYFLGTKITSQTCTRNVFSNVTFDSTPIIKGWTYNSGVFICKQSGVYNISFTTLISSSNSNGEVASVRLVRTSRSDPQHTVTEVPGSSITKAFINNSQWSNSIILSVNSGDVLSLQFTGNSGSETISTVSAIAGETPVLASLKATLF